MKYQDSYIKSSETSSKYISLKKMRRIKENGKNYFYMEFKNNYKEPLTDITYIVRQYDSSNKILSSNKFTYSNFIVNPKKTFIPKVKFFQEENCANIEFDLIDAKFENAYINNKEFYGDDINDEVLLNTKKKPIRINRILYILFYSLTILLTFLSIIFSTLYFVGTDDSYQDNQFQYDLRDNKLYIVDCYTSNKNIVIPDRFAGYEIAGIDDNIFAFSKVVSVEIKALNFDIGNNCFENCNRLESVKGINISVGRYSFLNCDFLSNVEGLSGEIDDYAFVKCDKLVNISSKNVSKIGSYSFYSCDKLENIEFPNSYLSKNSIIDCPNVTNISYGKSDVIIEECIVNAKKLSSLTSGEEYFESYMLGDLFNISTAEKKYFHFSNKEAIIGDSLRDFNFSNYSVSSDGDYEYIDDQLVLVNNTIDKTFIINKKMEIPLYVITKNNFDTVHIMGKDDFDIDNSIFESPNIQTLIIENDNVSLLKFDLKYIKNIIIKSTYKPIAQVIPETYQNSIIIKADINNKDYFNNTTLTNVLIDNEVNINVDPFNYVNSKIKILNINSLERIKNFSLKNVSRLCVDNADYKILDDNNIKSIVINKNYNSSINVLSCYKNLEEVKFNCDISNNNLKSIFGENIPYTLVTAYLKLDEVNDEFLDGCGSLKNIYIDSNKISSNFFNYSENLCNIYIEQRNSFTPSLATSLNNISFKSKVNIIGVNNNGILNSENFNIISKTNFEQYIINYKDKTYYYDDIFITNIKDVIDTNEDVVLFYDSSYSNLLINQYFSKENSIYIKDTQEETFTYYDDSKVTISYYRDDYLLESISYDRNELIELKEYNLENFYGWSISPSEYIAPNSVIESDISLYAYFINVKMIEGSSVISASLNGLEDYNFNYKSNNKDKVIMNIYSSVKLSIDYYDTLEEKDGSLYIYQITIEHTPENIQKIILHNQENKEGVVMISSNVVSTENYFKTLDTKSYTFKGTAFRDCSVQIESKEGYKILGIYDSFGNQVFDEYGNSTNYWLNNYVYAKLYVKYKKS